MVEVPENVLRGLIWCHQQPPSHRCGFLAEAKALLESVVVGGTSDEHEEGA